MQSAAGADRLHDERRAALEQPEQQPEQAVALLGDQILKGEAGAPRTGRAGRADLPSGEPRGPGRGERLRLFGVQRSTRRQ